MENDNLKKENSEDELPQIHVNEYGTTKDSTVVVEEKDRTVLLTDDETIIIPKETVVDVPPKNRARKIYAGMWGTTELVTVGLGMLAILTTILVFVFLVIPAQKELEANRARRDELENQLKTANSRYGNITNTQERVSEITRSVDDFEARFLPVETTGKAALAQQINGLIAAYGLINTTGPDYAPLEIADQKTNYQTSDGTGKSKFISIYPGQYITMTVDGTYQNLRRFIREIETSNNFVVIAAVELEPSENKEKQNDQATVQQVVNQPQQPQAYNPTNPNSTNYDRPLPGQQFPPATTGATKVDRGKTRGETVTLRLELATYFRRPNAQPQTASLER